MSFSKTILKIIEVPIGILLSQIGLHNIITISDRESKQVDSFFEPDSPDWFRWLNRSRTKSFVIREMGVYDEEEMCVAHKDDAGNWSLHTTFHNVECSVDVGNGDNFTVERLFDAMEELYELRPGPNRSKLC